MNQEVLSESKFTEKVYLTGVQPSFVKSIRRGSEHLANLNVGEKLWLRETRWRYRTILERISPTRVKIGLDKTTYLQEGIVIHRQRFKETSIVPSKVRREDNTDENHINDTTGHTIDLSRDSRDYSNHDKVDDSQSDGKSGEDDSVVLGSLRLQPIIVRVKSGDIVLLQKNKAVIETNFYGYNKPIAGMITCNRPEVLKNVQVGHHVYIDDGMISAIVRTSTKEFLELEIESPYDTTAT